MDECLEDLVHHSQVRVALELSLEIGQIADDVGEAMRQEPGDLEGEIRVGVQELGGVLDAHRTHGREVFTVAMCGVSSRAEISPNSAPASATISICTSPLRISTWPSTRMKSRPVRAPSGSSTLRPGRTLPAAARRTQVTSSRLGSYIQLVCHPDGGMRYGALRTRPKGGAATRATVHAAAAGSRACGATPAMSFSPGPSSRASWQSAK